MTSLLIEGPFLYLINVNHGRRALWFEYQLLRCQIPADVGMTFYCVVE